MKSIRLSLVFYFLVLLAGALGAVSWFVYQQTESTLEVAARNQESFLRREYSRRCQEAKDHLDERIRRQAHTLAGLARANRSNYEALYPLGAFSSPIQAQGYLTMPLWFAEAYYPPLASRLFWMQPTQLRIQSAEDVVANWDYLPGVAATVIGAVGTAQPFAPINAASAMFPGRPSGDRPVEYFQTFNFRGLPLTRSENLGPHWFTLPHDLRERAEYLNGYFDDVELAYGVDVRRVTLKTQVRAIRISFLPQPWRWRGKDRKHKGPPSSTEEENEPESQSTNDDESQTPSEERKPESTNDDAKQSSDEEPNSSPRKDRHDERHDDHRESKRKKRGGPAGFRGASFVRTLPTIYIQYGIDRSQLERALRSFRSDLESQLASRAASDKAELARLRLQLFWIAMATFSAVVCGGLILVHVGLAPLQRLSGAVARVSEKDFRLQLDDRRLPKELQPIADGVSEALLKLERAFEREKQAAADISHELRTPLAALMTTLEVTLRKPRTAEEYRDVLEDCRLSGKQMTQMVERLLALARLDAGVDNVRPQSVDVTELAQQCAGVVRPLVEARGLHLQLHLADSVPLVADPDKIREILNNLLHNAIQYNKPNGSIDLTVQRVNGSVAMAVRDTGIGISADKRQHIFERFYRVDPSRHADEPHAGLGLSIVKGYVELMGGTIDVQSSDKGTTFQVELPAKENGAN